MERVFRETPHTKYVFDDVERIYKQYKEGDLHKTWTEEEWMNNSIDFFQQTMKRRNELEKREREVQRKENELAKREKILMQIANLLEAKVGIYG